MGSLPVVDEGERLTGIVTDRDVAVRVVGRGLDSDATVVGDVARGMSLRSPLTMTSTTRSA